MRIGDLIRTKVATVGVPKGTIGLVVSEMKLGWTTVTGYEVQIFYRDQYGGNRFIYREHEVEVVSEARGSSKV